MVSGADKLTKLLLVAPSLHQGGLERVCVLTARLLAPYYDVTIAVFDGSRTDYDIQGLSVVDLHLPSRPGKAGKLLTWRRRVLALRRLKKKLGIRLSYSLGQTANLSNVFAGAGDRILCSIRSYQDMQNPRKIRLFVRRADRIVCCSEVIRQELAERYGCGTAVTLYNPIRVPGPEALREGKDRLFLEREDIRRFAGAHDALMMSMGRDDDVKGFWHLIKAFAVFRQELIERERRSCGTAVTLCQPVRGPGLVLIGMGDFAEYRQLAEVLGIAEHVLFTGVLREPHPLLAMADEYVLTSINEGFPNALLEAMALGVTPLAADCMTGPREILEPEGGGKWGTLLPPFSAHKDLDPAHIPEEDRRLARAMGEHLHDKAAGQRAMLRATEFTEERYMEAIREILGGEL